MPTPPRTEPWPHVATGQWFQAITRWVLTQVVGTSNVSQFFYSGLSYTVAGTVPPMYVMNNALSAWEGQCFAPLIDCLSNVWQYYGTQVYFQSTYGLGAARSVRFAFGSVTDTPAPSWSNALLLKWINGVGVGIPGRFWLPGIPLSWAPEGRIDPTLGAPIATLLGALSSPFTNSGMTFTPAMYSPLNGVLTPIMAWTLSQKMGVLYRRSAVHQHHNKVPFNAAGNWW